MSRIRAELRAAQDRSLFTGTLEDEIKFKKKSQNDYATMRPMPKNTTKGKTLLIELNEQTTQVKNCVEDHKSGKKQTSAQAWKYQPTGK